MIIPDVLGALAVWIQNQQKKIEPGASGLTYYCASTCVRSFCNWRASYVDSKPQKTESVMRGCGGWQGAGYKTIAQ